jgi:putative hydrolase of the HAD superfamily
MTAGITPTLQPPRALLLDAMGTLFGLRQSVGSTYAALAGTHGVAVEAAAIDRVFPALYRQAPPLAFPGLGGVALLEAERRWWGERIEEALRAAGAAGAPLALQRELFEHFAQPEPWLLYDDVLPVLRRWRTAGLRLAVVSNFDQRLHGLLERLELADLLDGVVVSSAAGAAKPSPLPFQLALEALGVSAAEAWHVGDSPEDVRGAAAAGVTCLRIRRP